MVFDIQALAVPRIGKDSGSRSLDNDERELFLRDHPALQIEHPAVTGAVAALTSALAQDDSLPDALYEKVRALREHTVERLPEVPEIIETGRARGRERAYTLVALCRAARIPARLAKGLVLRESANASLHFWAEVYQQDDWIPYDPVFGYRHTLLQN